MQQSEFLTVVGTEREQHAQQVKIKSAAIKNYDRKKRIFGSCLLQKAPVLRKLP